MTAVYDPTMPMTVAEVAAYMGVSEDTVRALIRAQHLPATQERPRGGYSVDEADAERVKQDRLAGRLAGPVQLTELDLNRLVDMQRDNLRLLDEADDALDARDAFIRSVRASSGAGYGAVTAMADALGMHRTAIQRIAGSEPKVREPRLAKFDAELEARRSGNR